MAHDNCLRRYVKSALAFCLLALFTSLPVMADDVTINATTFPDSTFRSYVIDSLNNGDSVLTDAKAQAVTRIDLRNVTSVTDLTGTNYFPKLRELLCGNNSIGKIDVSSDTALTRLELRNATVSSLDLSKNTKLQRLICNNAPSLTTLTLNCAETLTRLYCDTTALTSLNVSYYSKLTRLYCYDNNLTSLNVTGCTALDTLYCYNNKLTSLDVSGLTALQRLYCYNNSLTELDVSDLTSLQRLDCYSNSLTSLDVSGLTALQTLYCYSNSLTSLDVSGLTALQTLYCYSNSLTSLNVSGLTALQTLYCYSNSLTELDVSDLTSLQRLDCYSNSLTSLDVSGCTALQRLDCSRMTNASLASLNLGELTGITTLRCMGNSLTSLDVSKLNSLTTLRAESNELTALDLSNNTKVSGIINSQTYPTRTLKYDADKNEYYITLPSYIESKVSSIAFSIGNSEYSCTAEEDGDSIRLVIPLTDDDANALSSNDETLSYDYPTGSTSGNLTTMPVSMSLNYPSTDIVELTETNFPDDNILGALKEYDADGDGWLSNTEIVTIDSLDISGKGNVDLTGLSHLTYLRYLNCSNDSITSGSLSDGIKSNAYLEELICRNCGLTTLAVSANTNLVTLDCDSNAIATLSLPKEELAELHCEYNQLTSLDSIETVTTLHYLYCGHNNLSKDSVVDFSRLTSLVGLVCDSNKIQTLTLPNTTTLTSLNCSNNNITSLDLSNNTELNYLNCNANQLNSLDVTACTGLTTLLARENELTSIDVSKCTGLESLQLSDNKLTELDLSNNTALIELTVSDNQLDTLDVSNCSKLETVHCSDNKIASLNLGTGSAYKDLTFSGNKVTTIDLSYCTNLEILECQDNSLTSLTLPNSSALTEIDAHGQELQTKLYAKNDSVYLIFPAGFDSTKVSDFKINDETADFSTTTASDGSSDVIVESAPSTSSRVRFYYYGEDEDGNSDDTGETWISMDDAFTYNYKYKDGTDKDSLMDVSITLCAYTLKTNSTYNYASICLPFPYEIAEDTKAYTITSKGDVDSDGYTQLVLQEVSGVVPARTPLIVRSDYGAGKRIVFNMDTVTTTTTVNNQYLSGTLVDYDIPTGTTVYTMGVGTNSGKYGFWKYTGETVQANSVYITADNMKSLLGDDSASTSKGFVFVIEDDDTTTGIEAIDGEATESETGNGLWYTIQGVVLPAKPSAPGLYIHNGHKVSIH